jgi:hypothetical protein
MIKIVSSVLPGGTGVGIPGSSASAYDGASVVMGVGSGVPASCHF